MQPIQIKPDIYWIGINDRTTDLFEGLWPIQEEGISYNAYLINDEKKAVIDLSKEFTSNEFIAQIKSVMNLGELDYIIINHMEPDHTGALLHLKEIAPQAVILCSKKAAVMLSAYYGITDGVQVVENDETLNLGRHTLQFVSTPFVHWPETMMTYDVTEKVLFSCDGFGGYGALEGIVFDDECADLAYAEEEALRYFSNIVVNFSTPTLKAIKKLEDITISMVAPSHGLIWRTHPERIIQLYQEWAEYQTSHSQKGITLAYGSMYGNTERMMDFVAQGAASEGLPVKIFDVAHIHPSYILPSILKYQGVIIGSPTYEKNLYPPMAYLLNLVAEKRIQNRSSAFFGSYGWAGTAKRQYQEIITPLEWQQKEPLDFNGRADDALLKRGFEYGAEFAREIKTL